MFISSPATLLRKRAKLIVLVGVLFALLSGAMSFLFPLRYRADADVLIISKSRYGVDPYTIVKSAERVGDNLVAIMKTTDFYDKVMANPNVTVDKSRFEGPGITERTKRKRWEKDVTASVVYGTGVVRISAYHTDPEQASTLAGAAASTLSGRGWEYVGGDVTIKVVNPPVVSRFPVQPNIILNAIMAFVFGMLFMSVLVVRRGHR